MQTATLVIAVLALVTSVASLVWNMASWIMTGGRVKVELRIGAMGHSAMITSKPSTVDGRWFDRAAEQGYDQPIMVAHVVNAGRLPLYIKEWGIKSEQAELRPIGFSFGPDLPHKLEAGADETWACPLDAVQDFVKAGKEALGDSGVLRAYVRLSDGRLFKSKNTAR